MRSQSNLCVVPRLHRIALPNWEFPRSSIIDPVPEIEAAEADEQSTDASVESVWDGRLAAFRALRHRNFRLFFVGQLISLVGTWMQSVAQAWLVLRLTNSAMALGLVAFAAYFPMIIVGLFAGAVVDRVDRRRLIVIAQTLLMFSAFALAAITWAGVVRVEHVIILAAFNGLVSSFDMPGRQAFVVEMVGRDDLPNAIAMNSMIFNGARMVGPAVAGLLIAFIGVTGCFFLNGISYLAVIWSLLEMELPRRAVAQAGGSMIHRVREGLHYVWHHAPSLYLMILVAINSGFGMQYTVLIPVFAKNILHSGATGYGFMMAAQGLGAVAGAIAMNSRAATPRALRQNLVFGLFCTAFAIFAFGISPSMPISLLAQMFIGAGLMHHMVTTNTMLQMFVSDELRGRVMSLYTLSFIGTAPLGSLEVGFLGDHASPRIAVVVCAVFSLLCGGLLLTKLKMFAQAQDEHEREMAEAYAEAISPRAAD